MRHTTALLAATLLLAAGAAGCSDSSGSDEPKPTATVTKTATPSLSTTEARAACVDAWAQALLKDADLGVEDEPKECAGLPGDDRLDRYMEGMQKRNAINRG
ncbi:hypothetical protein [Streptomyces violaceus]|uniref:Lipoprotein n=1 Tax=Streptomyces violaceus TaxID=1936 RepID=A0ABY9UPD6_STRVL|nr:hypothetical protein [Streptomyces janthinus]WND24071.1 hypothetical protein RI060_42895 [Streptomyces janthinus]GGS96421.1 hypothetical protein GCM10010270_80490 [Streptomyces janthinus]